MADIMVALWLSQEWKPHGGDIFQIALIIKLKKILLVILDFKIGKHFQILFLKSFDLVMLFLGYYVLYNPISLAP